MKNILDKICNNTSCKCYVGNFIKNYKNIEEIPDDVIRNIYLFLAKSGINEKLDMIEEDCIYNVNLNEEKMKKYESIKKLPLTENDEIDLDYGFSPIYKETDKISYDNEIKEVAVMSNISKKECLNKSELNDIRQIEICTKIDEINTNLIIDNSDINNDINKIHNGISTQNFHISSLSSTNNIIENDNCIVETINQLTNDESLQVCNNLDQTKIKETNKFARSNNTVVNIENINIETNNNHINNDIRNDLELSMIDNKRFCKMVSIQLPLKKKHNDIGSFSQPHNQNSHLNVPLVKTNNNSSEILNFKLNKQGKRADSDLGIKNKKLSYEVENRTIYIRKRENPSRFVNCENIKEPHSKYEKYSCNNSIHSSEEKKRIDKKVLNEEKRRNEEYKSCKNESELLIDKELGEKNYKKSSLSSQSEILTGRGRRRKLLSLREEKKIKPNCTVCSFQSKGSPCQHPLLKVLICVSCERKIYNIRRKQIDIPVDDYCSWCFNGGELICCDTCDRAFCQPCIKRNLGENYVDDNILPFDKWSCLKCNPKPLLEHIKICYKLLNKDFDVFERKLASINDKKSNYCNISTKKNKFENKKRKVIKINSDDIDSSSLSSDEEEDDSYNFNVPENKKSLNMKINITSSSSDECSNLSELEEKNKIKKKKLVIKNMDKKNCIILENATATTREICLSSYISKRLKRHQEDGIKFMYDMVIKNVENFKNTPKENGEGCILAHCMGLGKSVQIVGLLETLFRNFLIHTALILCPYNACEHWVNEFNEWIPSQQLPIFKLLGQYSKKDLRDNIVNCWYTNGGVLIISYQLYRTIMNKSTKLVDYSNQIYYYLQNPGPDILICDEGHLLKNHKSFLHEALKAISTRRRIVLTGTPIQNNLMEYFVMIDFIKPELLGCRKTFECRFNGPITRGQLVDATDFEVKYMKKRCHVLYNIIRKYVQRYDHTVLIPYLPPKREYTIYIRSTEFQQKLYKKYYDEIINQIQKHSGLYLFQIFATSLLIGSHPATLLLNEKRNLNDLDDDIDKNIHQNVIQPPPSIDNLLKINIKWYQDIINDTHLYDINLSAKMTVLNHILNDCIHMKHKIVIFSQSLSCLDLISLYLTNGYFISSSSSKWLPFHHFFRIDGSVNLSKRTKYIQHFNNPNHPSIIMLISTLAGGIAINLKGACRIVLMDCSWNPSHDIQSMFRVYRLGQDKPVIIYRLVSQGLLEECIYNRQVLKISLSSRVVDHKQMDRVFGIDEINKLYTINVQPISQSDPNFYSTPELSNEPAIGFIMKKLYPQYIVRYIEHNSLLTDDPTQNLTDEEKNQALNEYFKESNLSNIS